MSAPGFLFVSVLILAAGAGLLLVRKDIAAGGLRAYEERGDQ